MNHRLLFADIKCSIEKIDWCKNYRGNSFTSKVGEHIPLGFLMPTISLLKNIEKSIMYK